MPNAIKTCLQQSIHHNSYCLRTVIDISHIFTVHAKFILREAMVHESRVCIIG